MKAGLTHEKPWAERDEIIQNCTSLPALKRASFFDLSAYLMGRLTYHSDLMREPCA
jgi:hypothetical protein